MISFKVEMSQRTGRVAELIVIDHSEIGDRSITMAARDIDLMLALLSPRCELIGGRLIQLQPNPAPLHGVAAR